MARNLLDSFPAPLRSRLQAAHYVRLLRRMNLDAEPDLVIAKALVDPGDTVVDVGANIGVYSRWLSTFVGSQGRVLAIEPVAATFTTLQQIANRLRWSNVTLIAAAVSDQSGIVRMRIPEDDRGMRNYYLARVADDGEDAESVRALTIDELLGTRSSTFIKIDVEGHELPSLRGGLATIRRCQPALLVEINRDGWGLASGGAAIVELLRGEGYDVWSFDGNRLERWDGGVDRVNYWFLRPSHVTAIKAHRPALVAGDVIRQVS